MSRTPCLVPHCRRTCGPRAAAADSADRNETERIVPDSPQFEWICGKHWPAVPLAYRKALFRARRRFHRLLQLGTLHVAAPPADVISYRTTAGWRSFDIDGNDRLLNADEARYRLWRRCARAAIERAVGMG